MSNSTALEELACSDNQLATLDVSKNTALWRLYCYNNQLTALDVSKNTALGELSCFDNQLTALDVSKNTMLIFLSCDNNAIPYLNLSYNKELELHVVDHAKGSPQTLSGRGKVMKQTANGWELDMSKVLGGGDIAKVKMTDGSSYDAKTGIALYVKQPEKISYTYGTGRYISSNTEYVLNVSMEITSDNIEVAILYGDVNGDGKVNAIDALWVRQASAGSRKLDDLQAAAADVNKDGKINAVDALWIRQISAGSRVVQN